MMTGVTLNIGQNETIVKKRATMKKTEKTLKKI